MDPLASFFAFDARLFLEGFVLLFAVFDPVGTVPIFMAITEDHPEHRRKIVRQGIVIAGAILSVFALFGWLIFDIFGITIDDFRIAGGIVLFAISLDHLMGRNSRSKGLEPSDVAAFPLAIPLLAGPGAISTVVILAGPPYSPLLALLTIAGNTLVAYLLLSRSELLSRVLGKNGTNALSKVTALLIAALAISFVVTGVSNIVNSLR